MSYGEPSVTLPSDSDVFSLAETLERVATETPSPLTRADRDLANQVSHQLLSYVDNQRNVLTWRIQL